MSRLIPNGGKPIQFFVPFSKTAKDDDDDLRMCWGYASTEAIDAEGEIVTREALEGALPDYMQFANIREMHQLSAVGTANEADIDDVGLYIGAKVVDDAAWKKVKTRVYKGFSIGGRALEYDDNKITKLELIEISLVDRPANPEALIEMFKGGSLNKAFAKAERIGKAIADGQPRMPMQEWSCGMLGHSHAVKDEAVKCIADQEAKFGKGTEIIELREAMAAGINALDVQSLQIAVNTVRKATGDKPVVTKTVTTDKPVAKAEPEPAVDPAVVDTFVGRFIKSDFSKATSLLDVANIVGTTEAIIPAVIAKAQANYASTGSSLPPNCAKALEFIPVDKKLPDPPKQADKAAPTVLELITNTLGIDRASIKGDYGAYDEVFYADPGLQKDGKARFPLMEKGTLAADRIKGAWAYWAKADHKSLYGDVTKALEIENRIVAAYKAAVDPDGPPSMTDAGQKSKSATIAPKEGKQVSIRDLLATLGKADASGNLRKGLSTACSAVYMLQSMDWLHDQLVREAAVEGDNSTMPARLKGILENFSELCKEVLAEEVEEMLNNREEHDLSDNYVTYAAKELTLAKALGVSKLTAKALKDAVGDKTGAPKFAALNTLIDALEKAEAEQTQSWSGKRPADSGNMNDKWPSELVAKAQDMHDLSVSCGAICKAEDAAKAKKDDKKDPDAKDEKDEDKDDKDKAAKADKSDEPGGKADKAKKDDKKKPAKDDEDEEEDDEDADKAAKASKAKSAAPVEVVVPGLDKLVEGLTALKAQVEDLSTRTRNPSQPKGNVRAVDKADDYRAPPQIQTRTFHDAPREGAPSDADKQDVLKGLLTRPQILRAGTSS